MRIYTVTQDEDGDWTLSCVHDEGSWIQGELITEWQACGTLEEVIEKVPPGGKLAVIR